jgi:hypothetical protein
LRGHLHFTLGPRERAGLELFQELLLAGTKPGPGVMRVSRPLAASGTRFGPG